MELTVIRYNNASDYTDGLFFIDGKFYTHTLEDEKRTIKVYAETRIPEGRYQVKLRAEGGFHQRYLARYGSDWHKGMLHVTNVPNFEYILIHVGNTDDDTAGCLLVAMQNNADDKGFVGGSRTAYQKIYPVIRDALLNGDEVYITYKEVEL